MIKGLNHILDLAVAEYRSQGGTWIIPGRGRLSDTADVASYRNMLSIIRDRVQDLIDKGMTVEQVKAARPTMDFDGRYGSDTGSWTTAMFVEAVYKSLKEKKNDAQNISFRNRRSDVAGAVAAYGHHSYAATYDTAQRGEAPGQADPVFFRNPHSYVTIQAPDAKGAMQRWSVEWAGTAQLSNRGITQETLKISDAITIVGRPSRVSGRVPAADGQPDTAFGRIQLGDQELVKLLTKIRGLPLPFLAAALMLLACVPGYAQRGGRGGAAPVTRDRTRSRLILPAIGSL